MIPAKISFSFNIFLDIGSLIFYCSPPSGTVVCVVFCFPQVPFPSVIPPAVIGSSPPSGTEGCYLRNFSRIINTFPESAARQNPRKV